MAYSNIERSYHDVTTLDKATALGKVKDVMDISSSAEFFTIVKDLDSIKPDCRLLNYEVGEDSLDYYIKPHKHYIIKSDIDSPSNNTKFGARVKITKMEFNTPLNDSNFNNEEKDNKWTQDIDRIMRHCKSLWLYNNTIYGIPWFRKSNGNLEGFENLGTVYHLIVPLSQVKSIEFDVFEVHPSSSIASGDDEIIFNILQRYPSIDDYVDILQLTQSPYNRFSLSICGNLVDSDIEKLENWMRYFKYVDGNVSNKTFIHNFMQEYYDNYDSSANYEENMDPGPMRFGGAQFNLEHYNSSVWYERLKSGETIMLYTDMNHHAATFAKNVLTAVGFSNVNIHTHSTKQLFTDVTFNSITHPFGEDLIIGHGERWGIAANSWSPTVASNRYGRVCINETLSMLNNVITDVNRITSETIDATEVNTNSMDVALSLDVGNSSTNSSISRFYGNVTVTGILDVASSFKINNIGEKTGSALNNLPILTIGTDGIFYKTSIKFNTNYNTATAYNSSPATAADVTANENNRQFLAIDGNWRALTPTYLGVSADTHTHGNISRDGKITSDTAIATNQHLVLTHTDNKIIRSPLVFNTTITNKKLYLSKYGEFNGVKDLLFHGFHNSTDGNSSTLYYSDGSIKNLDNAVELGIYKFSAESDNRPGASANDLTTNSSTTSTEDKHAYFTTNTFGIVMVMTDDGCTGSDAIPTGQTHRNIVQLAFTGAPYTMADGSNGLHIFVRALNKTSSTGSWSPWRAFSKLTHNHDRIYPSIDNAKIKSSVKLYSSLANVGNDNADSLDYFLLKYTSTSSGNTTTLKAYDGMISRANTSSEWNIGILNSESDNNYMVVLSRDTSGNKKIQIKSPLEIKNTVKFNEVNTVAPATASTDTAANQYVLLTDISGTTGTLKRSGITQANLNSLAGYTSTLTTDLSNITTNFSNHTSTSAANSAHGNLKSNGTVEGSDATIANGDKLLIGDKNSSNKYELAKTSIAFDGSSTTTYLSKKGTWETLPGDASNDAHGYMTAEEHQHLATMWSIWQDDNTGKVDKIVELLDVFSDLDTNSNIVTLLGNKFDKAGGKVDGIMKVQSTNEKARLALTSGNPTVPSDAPGYLSTFTNYGTVIWSNAISFRDPKGGNDSGWIRHNETTANAGELEIAVGDDGTSQNIYFRGYGTDNLPKYQFQVPTDETNGTLASQAWAKNNNGVTAITTSGTGLSSNNTTSNNTTHTATITIDSSSAGNAAANKVVLRNDAGSIQSEKFAVSSGTTTKATMQYNSSTGCLEIIC